MAKADDAIRLEIGGLKFSWNLNKAQSNRRKHGVTFEEAASCWLDPFGLEFDAFSARKPLAPDWKQ